MEAAARGHIATSVGVRRADSRMRLSPLDAQSVSFLVGFQAATSCVSIGSKLLAKLDSTAKLGKLGSKLVSQVQGTAAQAGSPVRRTDLGST